MGTVVLGTVKVIIAQNVRIFTAVSFTGSTTNVNETYITQVPRCCDQYGEESLEEVQKIAKLKMIGIVITTYILTLNPLHSTI